MNRLTFAPLLVALNAAAFAQEDEQDFGTLRPHGSVPVADMREAARIVHDFMNGLKLGKADRAFENIRDHFAPAPVSRNQAITMVQQVLKQAGTPFHYVFVGTETLPYVDRYVVVKVMSYHDRTPVGWRLQMYRVNKTWRVLRLRLTLNHFISFFKNDELTHETMSAKLKAAAKAK